MIGIGIGITQQRRAGGGGGDFAINAYSENLAADPPTFEFTSARAGTWTWDFHSGSTAPAAGAGDIATGTAAVSVGVNSGLTIDLSAFPGETGYIYHRVIDGAEVSNIIRSGVLTTASSSIIYDSDFDEATDTWPTTSLGGMGLIVTAGGSPTVTHLNSQVAIAGSGTVGALLIDNGTDSVVQILQLPVTAGETYDFDFRGCWDNTTATAASGAFWIFWAEATNIKVGTTLERTPGAGTFNTFDWDLDYSATGLTAPTGATRLLIMVGGDNATNPFSGTNPRWTRGRVFVHKIYLAQTS